MYRHHEHSAGAEHPYRLPAGPGSSAYAQTHVSNPIYGIDSSSPASHQHLFPVAAQQAPDQSPHPLRSMATASGAMHPPLSTHPKMSNTGLDPVSISGFEPTDRSLPSTEATSDSIADVYVEFILYCNPNFPLDVDTTTLKAVFQNPPRSDNKEFETFRLFELIKRFDAKDIKTWGQLALELGVEAPDTSKGQSTQKVQQYSVRLKRWMRAMHIDAFFEYLLGKTHTYFMAIPPPNDPYPPDGRDGVAAEEDLAIRALDPSFRPKRGRRRNSENGNDDYSEVERSNKQPRLLDSAAPRSAMPLSAVPLSAHPDGYNDPWAIASAVTPQTFTPWSARPSGPASAVPTHATSHLRWPLGQTPSTPHPASAATTSMSAHLDAAFDGDPKSAVTPSTRRRRRHGPAVSSAWSSSNTPGAKPRGRPPANRNVQDGPYGTFPADPNSEKSSTTGPTSNPAMADPQANSGYPSPKTSSTPTFQAQGEGRPGRLSLQVPPRAGGPVRLATPPTVLVNGETKESETRSDADDVARATFAASSAPSDQSRGTTGAVPSSHVSSGFSFEALKRAVASDLLRANTIGRRQRLTGDEAKRLADSVLDRMAVPRSGTSNTREEIARYTAACWLGVGNQLNAPLGPSAGHGKRVIVTRLRTDTDGYEEITYDEDAEDVREVFDMTWHVSQGACMGSFEIKGLTLGAPSQQGPESTHDLMLRKVSEYTRHMDGDGWLESSVREVAQSAAQSDGTGEENIDWRARCKALEFGSMLARGEVERQRQRMVEKVIDAML